MEETTLRNMPKGQLFEFANDSYVWKITRMVTRNGNYLDDKVDFTEVFRMTGDGELECVWSGRMSDNESVYNDLGLDSNNSFFIFSYDNDSGASFVQEQDLKKAPAEVQIKALELEKPLISATMNTVQSR